MGACELMFKSTGGYPMATKASSTLVLIIKKHSILHGTSCVAPNLPWSFGFDARPTYLASARPIVGPSG